MMTEVRARRSRGNGRGMMDRMRGRATSLARISWGTKTSGRSRLTRSHQGGKDSYDLGKGSCFEGFA